MKKIAKYILAYAIIILGFVVMCVDNYTIVINQDFWFSEGFVLGMAISGFGVYYKFVLDERMEKWGKC